MAKKGEDFIPLYQIVDDDYINKKGYLYNGFALINPDFRLISIRLFINSTIIIDSPLDIFMRELAFTNHPGMQFQSTAEALEFIANNIRGTIVFRKISEEDRNDRYCIYIG